MPDHKPTPQPTPDPQKDRCEIQLHGYVECCCNPEPQKMCTVIKHLPCSIEGEQIPAKLNEFLNMHPGYVVQQVLDHGHDGWTIILNGPCC